MFRLVQEGLTNVAKHADAQRVQIRVADLDAEDVVVVEIRDDGRGFDPNANSEGFGLLGMRERVAAHGGTVEVTSSPGDGTHIVARLRSVRRSTRDGADTALGASQAS
jgi:signal transduction histidine kinase